MLFWFEGLGWQSSRIPVSRFTKSVKISGKKKNNKENSTVLEKYLTTYATYLVFFWTIAICTILLKYDYLHSNLLWYKAATMSCGALVMSLLDLAVGMDTEEMDVVATAAYDEATKDLLD